MSSDIPGFDANEEYEELLTEPLSEMNEETRQNVQRYKAQKLKAKRDAGESTAQPEWWSGDRAPETVDDVGGNGAPPQPSEEAEPEAEQEESGEESEPEPDPEPAEKEVDEQDTSTKEEAAGEDTAAQPAPAEGETRVPQIGWSSSWGDEEGKPPQTPSDTEETTQDTDEEEPEEAQSEEPAEEAEEPTESPEEEVAEDTGEEATQEEPAPQPAGEAGEIEVPEVDTSDIPGHDADPELDELLTEPVAEMDEETRQKVQTYKSRVLKALRDSGESGDTPPWWSQPSAPETVEETDQSRPRGEGAPAAPAGEETAEPETKEEPEEEPEPEAESAEEPEETEPAEDEDEPPAEEEAAEETGQEEEEEPQLSREELGEHPSTDELIQAGLLDGEVEREESHGMFSVTIDKKKASLSYTESQKTLTLHGFNLPTTVDDEEWKNWLIDALCKAAFDYAEENELEVIPQASEISKGFLLRHSDYFDQVNESSQARRLTMRRRMAQAAR